MHFSKAVVVIFGFSLGAQAIAISLPSEQDEAWAFSKRDVPAEADEAWTFSKRGEADEAWAFSQ